MIGEAVLRKEHGCNRRSDGDGMPPPPARQMRVEGRRDRARKGPARRRQHETVATDAAEAVA